MPASCFIAMSVDTENFLKNTSLDVLIPQSTDFRVEDVVEYIDDVASFPKQRSLLYFGMQRITLAKGLSSYSFIGMC